MQRGVKNRIKIHELRSSISDIRSIYIYYND